MKPDDDRRTHYRVGENLSACVAGGDLTTVDVWGHWIVADRDAVDCTACLEWLHA